MTLKIIEEKHNALFGRKEVKASIESKTTPSRKEITEMLAQKFSVHADHVKITKIAGSFGSKVFTILASIYSSKEEKNIVELKKKKETAVAAA